MGRYNASLPKLAWNLAKHSMIFSIALTAAAYQEWGVDTVNATTGLLVQAASPSGATSLAIALDQMDVQGGEYAMTVLGHGMTLMPIGGWLDLIAGIVIMVSDLALMALIGIWGISPRSPSRSYWRLVRYSFRCWLSRPRRNFLMRGSAKCSTIFC